MAFKLERWPCNITFDDLAELRRHRFELAQDPLSEDVSVIEFVENLLKTWKKAYMNFEVNRVNRTFAFWSLRCQIASLVLRNRERWKGKQHSLKSDTVGKFKHFESSRRIKLD